MNRPATTTPTFSRAFTQRQEMLDLGISPANVRVHKLPEGPEALLSVDGFIQLIKRTDTPKAREMRQTLKATRAKLRRAGVSKEDLNREALMETLHLAGIAITPA